MAIIIKGMKKPKSCYKKTDGKNELCPFVNTDDACVILLAKGMCEEGTWAEQYSKCPLVEVPEPHGRLIDADALIVAYDAQHEGEPGRARKLIEDAPTVIEGEGKE